MSGKYAWSECLSIFPKNFGMKCSEIVGKTSVGDVIVKLDSKLITNFELTRLLTSKIIGNLITLSLLRGE